VEESFWKRVWTFDRLLMMMMIYIYIYIFVCVCARVYTHTHVTWDWEIVPVRKLTVNQFAILIQQNAERCSLGIYVSSSH